VLALQPVTALHRHQLVCLSDDGWRRALAREWDDEARECLSHWARHRLPLVVTRQPIDVSRGGDIAVGLAAPAQWGRRRIALRVSRADVVCFDEFPRMESVTEQIPVVAREAWRKLAAALCAAGITARVYGSHGWQHLTQLRYVRRDSDIDLWLDIADVRQASVAIYALTMFDGPGLPRLDGELVFADGNAFAWREWQAWCDGRHSRILSKSLTGPALTPELRAQTAALPTAHEIGHAATLALYDELALSPKPGLVTLDDCGSHDDMDANTFMRSLFALRPHFIRFAELGAAHAPFESLERCGLDAEQRMLAATGGINTHRGAIFTLGLLCAAAGAVAASALAIEPARLRQTLMARWGAALSDRAAKRATSASSLPGGRAAQRYGLRGASAEAALGFPVLFEVALPAWELGRLDTLFRIMAVLDDCNLAHRGGVEGLRFAQDAARQFIAQGGSSSHGGLTRARAIGRAFVARRLSPGGAADLLAAACWFARMRANERH